MIATVSLETAKLLKDSGFKQDTSLYWFAFGHGIHEWQLTDRILDKKSIKGWRHFEKNNKETVMYASPTTDELLSELPILLDGYKLNLYRLGNGLWVIDYGHRVPESSYRMLPEALAKMWLFLKSERLIK